VVMMGSGADTAHDTVEYLNRQGEKVGVLKIRLYRPFSLKHFIQAMPASVKKISVLDRTKEPGSIGEPLYLDVIGALEEAIACGCAPFKEMPLVVGGRYGLGSKDFTPAMLKGVFDDLNSKTPKNHFSVGIEDDVSNNSVSYDSSFSTASSDVYRAMFYGLGADGTVSANKNSIKIIGDETDNYAQGYFVYDSKKAGSITVSHLRFGKNPIRRPYLIDKAQFIACHNPSFLEKYDMLANIEDGGTFLLTSSHKADEVWDTLPIEVQEQMIAKNVKFYVVDAISLAESLGLGPRINTIMQTAFFKISGIIPIDTAVSAIKKGIKKTYGNKGEAIVEMNNKAVDAALDNTFEVSYPKKVTSKKKMPPAVCEDAPDFVKDVTGEIMAMRGDLLPVSKMPCDGKFPVGTAQYEKRNIAVTIPVWEPEVCVQCGTCSLVCPHACIRLKAYDESDLSGAPATFKSVDGRGKLKGKKFTVQVAPEDCTGCGVCTQNCPGKEKGADGELTGRKAINLALQEELRAAEAENWDFFLALPETDPSLYTPSTVQGSQFVRPLFEFSGACAGCGETPYVKLVTQLFGDRTIVANATGCSSIYGGNLPTTPYTCRTDGRGPAWSNSLFEDNAEFGMGFRLTIDKFREFATELLDKAVAEKMVDSALAEEIKSADQSTQQGVEEQRARVAKLKASLCADCDCAVCKQLESLSDYLVKKSVWIVGGDGWAYDIGYGGLDHVIASGKNVNLLVLDTEVYSNTGGQMSKSTPRGSTAKFAAGGKTTAKKDLGMMAMNYGSVYVGCVSLANPAHMVKTILEAEAYDGPSLIICYAHCIAHGINNTFGIDEQKKAIASGHWILYRYNPELADKGENPLKIDSKEPTISFKEYAMGENRYRVLQKIAPADFEELMAGAQQDIERRHRLYQHLAKMDFSSAPDPEKVNA